jgi:rSAM/selenodomain-associated transferase 1
LNHLAVFARPPVAGRVKPRLSPSLPPALAAELYSALLLDTLDAARECGADARSIWWAEDRDGLPRAEGFVPRLQSGAGRTARLANAFDALLASPGDRAIVVVADLPALSADHLDRAFAALGRHDAVFGPAEDGGYWLVGQRRLHAMPRLFTRVRWSSPHALADTLANLAPGETHARVATLADVDDGAAYARRS